MSRTHTDECGSARNLASSRSVFSIGAKTDGKDAKRVFASASGFAVMMQRTAERVAAERMAGLDGRRPSMHLRSRSRAPDRRRRSSTWARVGLDVFEGDMAMWMRYGSVRQKIWCSCKSWVSEEGEWDERRGRGECSREVKGCNEEYSNCREMQASKKAERRCGGQNVQISSNVDESELQ